MFHDPSIFIYHWQPVYKQIATQQTHWMPFASQCLRAGRRGRYWCDFTLHCTGLAATAATWDYIFLCFIEPSKVSKNTTCSFECLWHQVHEACGVKNGLCLSLIYPNMTCWSLHRWVGSNKSWKQRRSSLRRLWPKIAWWKREILFLGLFGGLGTLTYKHIRIIYASMICLNTHIVILCNIMSLGSICVFIYIYTKAWM